MIENIIPEFKVLKDKHKISFKIPFDYIDADDITVILKKHEIERVLEKEEYIIEDGVFKYPANDAIPYMKEECEVIIRRNTPIEQIETSDVAYKSKDIERLSDKHTMIEQELALGLTKKQDTLVSCFNIKTINGKSLLGHGNINIVKGELVNSVSSVNYKVGDVILDGNDIPATIKGETKSTQEHLVALSEQNEGFDEKLAEKQDKLIAGPNITIVDNIISSTGGGGEGGTTNYNDLTNKPQINSIELVGNTSLDDLGIQPKGEYITADDLPHNVSDLNNDAGFITRQAKATSNLYGTVKLEWDSATGTLNIVN